MARHAAPSSRAAVLGRLGDAVVNLTAVLGAICILATIAAFFFGVNIALFKTGSMSPSIPAGSAAVSLEIDAADARVGDVVTVDRGEGRLPVTHRVVDTMPLSDGGAALILKGDANEGNDPFPYEVRTVNRVVWSAPGIGHQLARFEQAPVIGGITIFATLLVVWAFWPRKDEGDDEPSRTAPSVTSAADLDTTPTPARAPAESGSS
ncbi:S26 family signal peptidase [Dietzia sp. 179-F 9C3 NHS]|uniref:S26 family signal peptidase n=1 Tax=Dietzia sp. 179-F 9C3 NHS TaxID=3374295 RepID=UPI00387A1DFC